MNQGVIWHFWWVWNLVLLNGLKLEDEKKNWKMKSELELTITATYWAFGNPPLTYYSLGVLKLPLGFGSTQIPKRCWSPGPSCLSPTPELQFSWLPNWLPILKISQSSAAWIFDFIFYLFIYSSVYSTRIYWNSTRTQAHLAREAENWRRINNGARNVSGWSMCRVIWGPKGISGKVSEERRAEISGWWENVQGRGTAHVKA